MVEKWHVPIYMMLLYTLQLTSGEGLQADEGQWDGGEVHSGRERVGGVDERCDSGLGDQQQHSEGQQRVHGNLLCCYQKTISLKRISNDDYEATKRTRYELVG